MPRFLPDTSPNRSHQGLGSLEDRMRTMSRHPCTPGELSLPKIGPGAQKGYNPLHPQHHQNQLQAGAPEAEGH